MIQANELTCIQQVETRPRSLKTGETIDRAGKQFNSFCGFDFLFFQRDF